MLRASHGVAQVVGALVDALGRHWQTCPSGRGSEPCKPCPSVIRLTDLPKMSTETDQCHARVQSGCALASFCVLASIDQTRTQRASPEHRLLQPLKPSMLDLIMSAATPDRVRNQTAGYLRAARS